MDIFQTQELGRNAVRLVRPMDHLLMGMIERELTAACVGINIR